MTSDGEALFRAICEQPWEDTPRLAYADWLDENGDPLRAEFIRLQIAVAKATVQPGDPVLLARAANLREQSQGQWTRGSPSGRGVRIHPDLRRGFYHRVAFWSVDLFVERAAEVFAWTPIDTVSVERVTPRTVADVLDSHYLRRLRWLSLYGSPGDAACHVVAACPNLTNLEGLELSGARISEVGALALAKSPHIARMRRLRLTELHRFSPQTIAFLKNRFDPFSYD